VRDGDAADGLGVVVGLRLSSRLMLKERPHVDAVLQQQTDAAARACTVTRTRLL